jgi:2,4-dienoyl-CoA reductase-like NADH-dependent reductase (Old Yellow Enzyme family)
MSNNSSFNNHSTNSPVFKGFVFPNGVAIKNRLVKASMEENMSNDQLHPSEELINLYANWAKGGAGLLLTGNVMVDHQAMTGPGGVALEENTELSTFEKWAEAAKQNDTKVWMQINHPGRQVYKKMQGKVYSPSDIPLAMGKLSKMFGTPIAMTKEQIHNVIERFGNTAQQAQKAGFDGVEIHAAHGYLLAQFLSPLVNKRDDEWGGSLQNRARILIEIIKTVKAKTNADFCIGVKLNSADFQRGGFDIDDAINVVKMLEPLNIDMVELSGGSYETPAMQGMTSDGRTLAREAYFLNFATQIAEQTLIPIMTTGGIRRLHVAENVLNNKVELVGLATALAMTPNLPNLWLKNPEVESPIIHIKWRNKTLKALATMAAVKRNLRRIGQGKATKSTISPLFTLLLDQIRTAKLTKRYLHLKTK